MLQIASLVTSKVLNLLSGDSGVPASVSAISDLTGARLEPIPAQQILALNVAPEIAEQSTEQKYPVVHVYAGKVVNLLREKSRTFSGEVHMATEVRVSQENLTGLETLMASYVDAVTQVLDDNRGDWGDGTFFAGKFEVSYTPIKRGGRNFIQTAKIAFVVDASV